MLDDTIRCRDNGGPGPHQKHPPLVGALQRHAHQDNPHTQSDGPFDRVDREFFRQNRGSPMNQGQDGSRPHNGLANQPSPPPHKARGAGQSREDEKPLQIAQSKNSEAEIERQEGNENQEHILADVIGRIGVAGGCRLYCSPSGQRQPSLACAFALKANLSDNSDSRRISIATCFISSSTNAAAPSMANIFLQIARVALQQHAHRLTALPILVLYLNDICNSRCLTCAIWQNNQRLTDVDARQMSDSLLSELYVEIERWKPLQVLLSGGEPTMHPRFANVVETIHGLGSSVLVVTNGFLVPSYPPALVSRVAEFFVSFDAPDPESYEVIRGVDGFSKLAKGVDFIRSITPRPQVVARSTLQRDNVGRLPELVESAERLGFDRISFLPVDLTTDAFGRDHRDHSVVADRIQPRAEDLDMMASGIEALEGSDRASFIESGIEKLRSIHSYFRALIDDTNTPIVRCNAPWVSAVIETTGKMRGCFFHRVIGTHKSINGPEARKFRRTLRVSEDPTCQRCVCSKMLRSGELLRMDAARG